MSKLDAFIVVAALGLAVSVPNVARGGDVLDLKRVTTVIFTDDVDTCSAFYMERLGFVESLSVPAQDPGQTGSQFVALRSGVHELMLQSFRSAEKDAPGTVARANPRSFMLYIEVDSLDAAIERMADLDPVLSRRTTFYGSEEVAYRAPCGTVVVLAEFPDTEKSDAGSLDEP